MWLSKFCWMIWVHLVTFLYEFPMIYLQRLWYAYICLNTILLAIIQTKRANRSVDYMAFMGLMFQFEKNISWCNCNTPPQLWGIIKSIIRSNIYIYKWLCFWSAKMTKLEHWILNFTRKSPFICRKPKMNKPFNHGYPWWFMDIHNSIFDA